MQTEHLIDLLQQAIEKEQQFYEHLIMYTDIGMAIVDRSNGKFLFANPSAERIWNRPLSNLLTLSWQDITDIDFIEEDQKNLETLNQKLITSYKMAKIYIIPPDNHKKVAFLEVIEIAKEEGELPLPYVLAIVIEHTQLQKWFKMTSDLISLV